MIRKVMHLNGICRKLVTFLLAVIMGNYLYGILTIFQITNLKSNTVPCAISSFTRLKLKMSRITGITIPSLLLAMMLVILCFGTLEKEIVPSIVKRLIKELFTLFNFVHKILIVLQLVELIQWSKFGI